MFTQQQQIPRSPLASTLTLVFHVSLLLIVIAITTALPNVPKIASRESITFITAAPLPDFEIPVPPAEPAPPPPPPPKPAPRIEAPRPEPPRAFEAPVVKPPPPAPVPERRVEEQPREVPPLPKPPAVVVGAFSEATAVARKPERTPDVVVAGFESASALAARTRKDVAVIDGFETAASRTTATRTGSVSDAGFGATAPTTTPRTAAVTTGAAGFGVDSAPKPAAVAPRQAPATSGFGETAAPPVRAAAPPPPKPRADRPVEVIFKPVPAYTDEARAQRIEGEVSLEVEFMADGQVRVIRVLRGLGHGLDEMASRAAQQIRFRPATANGVPVDFRANVNILFRLT